MALNQNEAVAQMKALASANADYKGQYNHILTIPPFACPRPRSRVCGSGKKAFVQVYMPTDYTTKKNALALMLRSLRIPKLDYVRLDSVFYIPYPKSTPKKNLIDGAFHRKKPDKDNFEKSLLDALEISGIIPNDSQIACGEPQKRLTIKSEGWIEFSLS
jgi:Holliday junction resolvase RusA-like endonuclease